MPPTDDGSTDDGALAAVVADRAGRLLLEIRADAPSTSEATPVADSALGKAGDRRAHELITAALRHQRPGDAVLSEEGVQPGAGGTLDAGHGTRRIWIVDPLDGTREFSEGRSDFAVHVALVENGRPVAGAVALPGDGLVLTTVDPPVLPPRSSDRIRILVSRTRPPVDVAALATALDAELVPMGSAGAKAMAVVRGHGDIYLHAGGQYEWDSAAPVAVARASGAHASRLDGSDLLYDRPDPWLPDLLICRPELAAAVLSILDPAP
jgi:3'(2'), 5'-bisphosphate nucleotidase